MTKPYHLIILLAALLQYSFTNSTAVQTSSDNFSPSTDFSSSSNRFRDNKINGNQPKGLTSHFRVPLKGNGIAKHVRWPQENSNILPEASYYKKPRSHQLWIPRRFGKRNSANLIEDYDNKLRNGQVQSYFDQKGSSQTAAGLIQAPDSIHIEAESNLNPLQFTERNGEGYTKMDSFQRARKGRLGRMPMAYGKRVEPESINTPSEFSITDSDAKEWNTFENQNEQKLGGNDDVEHYFFRNVKNRLYRMPVSFGKRNEVDDSYTPDNGLSEDNNENGNVDFILVGSNKQGKPETKEKDSYNSRVEILGNSALVFDDNKDDTNDKNNHHEGSKQFIRVSKSSLSRMPMSFGKRDYKDEENFTTDKAKTFQEIKDDFQEESPVKLTRRDSDKYQVLFQLLKSKFKSDSQGIMNSKIQKILDQMLARRTSLTRLTRSKLERMPITFGKRSSAGSNEKGTTNYAHNVKQRSLLNRMPLSFGKRQSSSSFSSDLGNFKDTKLNRMPLSFGKRQSFSSSLAELPSLEDMQFYSDKSKQKEDEVSSEKKVEHQYSASVDGEVF